MRIVRDGEPKTATSAVSQLLSSIILEKREMYVTVFEYLQRRFLCVCVCVCVLVSVRTDISEFDV